MTNKTLWTGRSTVMLLACAFGVFMAPLRAQSEESCPPCSFYKSEIASAKASLAQFEAELAKDKEVMESFENDYTGQVFAGKPEGVDAQEYVEFMKEAQILVDQMGKLFQKGVDRWNRAIAAQEKTIQNLEIAYDSCRLDYCPKRIGMAVGKGPAWANFRASGEYFVEEACPACDAKRNDLGELIDKDRHLFEDYLSAHANTVSLERQATEILDSFKSGGATSGPPSSAAEASRAEDDRLLESRLHEVNEKLSGAVEAESKAKRAWEDNQRAIEQAESAVGNCQEQSCVPTSKTEQPAAMPGVPDGSYAGMTGGANQSPHPSLAVDGNAEATSSPRGPEVLNSTKASGGGKTKRRKSVCTLTVVPTLSSSGLGVKITVLCAGKPRVGASIAVFLRRSGEPSFRRIGGGRSDSDGVLRINVNEEVSAKNGVLRVLVAPDKKCPLLSKLVTL